MGLLTELPALLRQYGLPIVVVLVFVHLLRNRYKPYIRDIPGPFLASVTDLWNFWHVCSQRSTREYQLLHQKYKSPLIRMGPNYVACSDPASIAVIYGWKRVFMKSEHYLSQNQFSKDGVMVENISAVTDEERHSKLKRAISNAYAMTTVVEFEGIVDSTSRTFMGAMESRFVDRNVKCPLDKWVQMYAFDIIGELTFSKQFGFLKEGRDIENMMEHTGKAMDYIGTIGQLPWVDKWLRIKNPLLRLVRPTTEVVMFTVKQIESHKHNPDSKCTDFLTRFLASQQKWPELLDDAQLYELVNTNVAAGSDTTGIALRQIIYSLMTHPPVYKAFLEELKSVIQARGERQIGNISWTEARQMKYLQAIIKECLRCHPALGEILPRVVPEGGVQLCGKFIPEGTVIGCNAWTIHQDKDVFGHDADAFRPERWLEEPVERVHRMEAMSFHFGAGNRICIGRHVALMEMSKFIPEFFRRYEVDLIDPKQWRTTPGWIVPQVGMDCYIRSRDPAWLED